MQDKQQLSKAFTKWDVFWPTMLLSQQEALYAERTALFSIRYRIPRKSSDF
jgi:hypothetical protein